MGTVVQQYVTIMEITTVIIVIEAKRRSLFKDFSLIFFLQ